MSTAAVKVAPGPTAVDTFVLRWWPPPHRFRLLDKLAVKLSQAGEVSAIWFAITALAAVTVVLSTGQAIACGAAIIGEWILTNRFVKRFVWRARPIPEHADPPGVRRPSSSSLPSGHSSASAFAAVFVGSATGWLVPMLVFALLVGCSRFHLRVHYPTDVFAGWLWGASLAAVLLLVLR